MKWLQCCGVALALAAMNSSADAGIFSSRGGCTDSKACGCDSTCQPDCCKPAITRPCNVNVHTYQRKCSDIKPPCCDSCDAPSSCCAPAACGPKCDPKCAAPCGNNGCSTDPACAAPCGNNNGCSTDPNCGCPNNGNACEPACAAPCGNNACAADPNCAAPCNSGCDACDDRCCDADPCEIAKLIYTSQTACYAKDRAEAIEDLGNDFDCVCNPEILTAMVYALNDADERVRKEAADEIGDQLRKNPCCCSKEIVAALTCALGDCDRGVRRQAEEGLEACGYEVVDGCCDSCDSCGDSCNNGACNNGCAPAAAPAPAAPEAAPSAPAAEKPATEAYFPSRLRGSQQTQKPARRSLRNLFSLLD